MDKDLFILNYDEEKNRVSVFLCGEIDHHSAVSIRHQIDDALMTTQAKALVFDLSKVDFMDSSGLGLIMGRYALMEKLNGETIIRDPSFRVKKMLSLAGIEKIIRIEKGLEKSNESK